MLDREPVPAFGCAEGLLHQPSLTRPGTGLTDDERVIEIHPGSIINCEQSPEGTRLRDFDVARQTGILVTERTPRSLKVQTPVTVIPVARIGFPHPVRVMPSTGGVRAPSLMNLLYLVAVTSCLVPHRNTYEPRHNG